MPDLRALVFTAALLAVVGPALAHAGDQPPANTPATPAAPVKTQPSATPAAPASTPATSAAPANTPAPSSAPANPQPPALRLPAGVRPLHYALDLTLVPSRDRFNGSVTIDLQLDQPTALVWLDARDLTIEQATIRAGKETLAARVVPGGTDFVGFVLPHALPAGAAQLTVRYGGRIDSERSRGIYRAAEGQGADDWYAYTFFESIDARRAFPCFDEPSFKVPWRITLHVRANHVALANAPVVSETPEADGYKRVVFADSKPLPSYLVAFVVGPFDVVDGGSAGRRPTAIRFIVPRGRAAQTAYARQVTPRIVKLLEDYPDLPYPFDKLDVAVVPRFWGTMEHPGLVALGQPLTLIERGADSLGRRQRYANIAIHELGHYWFGDYVTCRWWDDIWLNESFGSWFDAKLTDALEPSWRWLAGRADDALGAAMRADALDAASPLHRKVESEDDIEGAFDNGITYDKGSALLRMIEHWMGPEPFRAVVRRYLRAFAWKTASSADFIQQLELGGGADVAHAFASFVDQPGVPLVTARARCDGGKPRLELSQQRFLASGRRPEGHWQIPFCALVGDGKGATRQCTILKDAQALLPLDRCPTWVMPNAGGVGYYRSAYDGKALRALVRPLQAGTLDVMERQRVGNDLWALTSAGELPLGDALTLMPTLLGDGDARVTMKAVELLNLLHMAELTPAQRPRLARALQALLGARTRQLGWRPQPGEDPARTELRPWLWWLMTVYGDDRAAAAEARRLADGWLADRASLDSDMVPTVLALAAHDGDAAFFERLLAAARATGDRRERELLYRATGATHDPAQLQRALGLLIAPDADLRDTSSLLVTALHDARNREAAWSFLQRHFDELSPRLRSDEAQVLVEQLPAAFCDTAHRRAMSDFLRPRAAATPGLPHVLDEAFEREDACIASLARDRGAIGKFLSRY